MKEFFLRIYDFLVANDFPTLVESLREMEWSHVLRSAYTWLISLPILIFLLWTKRFKVLIALASLGVFVVLLQSTLPPAGEKIPLNDLLTFLGGSFVLVMVNLYFILVRD